MKPEDALFTKEYWLTEISFFHERMGILDLPKEEVIRLFYGLCYIASKTIEQNPSLKDFVLNEFMQDYQIIKTRLGEDWIARHLTSKKTPT